MKNIILLLFIALTTQVLASDPAKQREAFKKSYQAEALGDYAAAIKVLKDLPEPHAYETNLRLGWLHYMVGGFSESQVLYQKAIALMPASIEAKLGITYPLSALGQWDKVAKQYEEVLSIDPKNTKALYLLGQILYGKEQYDKALARFSAGLNLYPFDYDFNLMTAWTSYRLGKMREAKVLFEKVLCIVPDDASALEGLGLVK
jgi:tetratricopeptide (TPR) repeat protein